MCAGCSCKVLNYACLGFRSYPEVQFTRVGSLQSVTQRYDWLRGRTGDTTEATVGGTIEALNGQIRRAGWTGVIQARGKTELEVPSGQLGKGFHRISVYRCRKC
jgi:hypothetical protein